MWNRFGILTLAVVIFTALVDMTTPRGLAIWTLYIPALMLSTRWHGQTTLTVTCCSAPV
jgi:hypothetical protein